MCSFHSKYVSRSGVYYNRSNLVLMAFALIFQGPPVFTQSSEACTPVHVALLTSICAKESASPRGLDLHVGASDGSSHLFLDFSIVSICLNIALPYPTHRVICCGFPCVTYENTPYIYDTFSIKYRVKCSFKNNILRLHTTCQCKRSIPADALSRSLNWGPG